MADLYRDLARDYHWLFPDDIVRTYDSFGATSPGNHNLLEATLLRLAPGASILDCACGIGIDAVALARRGFSVTASDGSPAMVAQTRRRMKQSSTTMQVTTSTWRELPQRLPGRFAVVLCLGNAIVHARTRKGRVSALRSMRTVLVPKGVVVVDSRNWEFLYASRPRIIPTRRVIERDGVRCTSLYIWTIPLRFRTSCRAEIVLLFESEDRTIAFRRYVVDFQPLSHQDLIGALQSAGFAIREDTYQSDHPFYAVSASAD